MVTGSIHTSHCVTQPDNVTVTDNYYARHLINSLKTFKTPEFFGINQFPDISRY